MNTDAASEATILFWDVYQLLSKYKLNSTWKVLEAPPELNLRHRLTLLSFSRISKVPSFHLVVPRSMLLKRILTAPPLESLGTVVAMAYYPVGAPWRLGLVIRQILHRGENDYINFISTTTLCQVKPTLHLESK